MEKIVCAEMLTDRGYRQIHMDTKENFCVQTWIKQTEIDVTTNSLDDSGSSSDIITTTDSITVMFLYNTDLNSEFFPKLLADTKQKNIYHLILVFNGKLTHTVKNTCLTMTSMRIELYNITEKALQFNISKHKLVPKHERLTKHEISQFPLSINVNKFPILFDTDPIAVYYDFRPGDIIKITRPSDIITYRIVRQATLRVKK